MTLRRFKGPGINVVVGNEASPGEDEKLESWCLPKALLSHHSAFLKAACTRDFKEREDNCIKLPTDDPAIFALFVEWMIYQKYTLPLFAGRRANLHAETWVLGDKLMSPGFKNYAMGNLYTSYSPSFTLFASRAVSAEHFAYACSNAMVGSPLRRFYVDFVATYYGESSRVTSSTEEWDEVMQEHDDVRIFLLHALRAAPIQRKFLKDVVNYMEKDAGVLAKNHQLQTNTPEKKKTTL